MKNIIVATNNIGKITEIKRYFEEVACADGQPLFNILPLGDVLPNFDLEAFEDGNTFEENARKKVAAVARAVGCRPFNDEDFYVLADDSGLEIDALNGLPGVDSANFMGRETPYSLRFDKILHDMLDIPNEDRTARFICVMALYIEGEIKTFRATIEGEVADKPIGNGGFGYDPIFYIPKFDCTAAELPLWQKNEISHRGKALKMVVNHLK